MDQVRSDEQGKIALTNNYFYQNTKVQITDEALTTVSVLKIALENLSRAYGCNSGVIQCWTALQDELGILPYASLSLLQEEGLPFVCETDIHGAITELLVEAASFGEEKAIFAD